MPGVAVFGAVEKDGRKNRISCRETQAGFAECHLVSDATRIIVALRADGSGSIEIVDELEEMGRAVLEFTAKTVRFKPLVALWEGRAHA